MIAFVAVYICRWKWVIYACEMVIHDTVYVNIHYINRLSINTWSRNIRNITTNTSTKQSPIIGKLTRYRNARRCQAGASRGSSRPVTVLSSNGPFSYWSKVETQTERNGATGSLVVWICNWCNVDSKLTLYSGLGGSSSSGGVESVPHRKASSTE